MLIKLSKNISFQSLNGHTVVLLRGTDAMLDIDNMVAFADGYHFDISFGEFWMTQ